jgi:hypothetical protein
MCEVICAVQHARSDMAPCGKETMCKKTSGEGMIHEAVRDSAREKMSITIV